MKELKQQFLDYVCAEIKAKTTHPEIRQELASHLEDLICEREALGDTQNEAVSWAITQMGNPKSLGKELHQIHRPRVPWGLFGVIVLLSAISLIGMGSFDVGYGASYKASGYHINALENQSKYILMGLVLMIGMYYIDFKKLKSLSWLLYGSSIVGIIVSVRFGIEMNGVRRIFSFLGISIDIISYSPYLLMIALAGILLQKRDISQRTWRSEAIEITIMLAPALMLFVVKSFPELIVYLLSALALYVWNTRHWVRGLVMGSVSLTGGLVYIFNNNLLKLRIMSVVNPNLSEDHGYIYRVIHEVVTSAGWWGHGFGSVQGNLPYVYSDMLSVYLIHCFGWAGGLLLLSVIFWFFIKLLSTIRSIRQPYGQAIVVGMALVLVIRLVYGLAVLSGSVMLTSISFPFLSYGSHVLIEYAAIGLLMGIYRRKDIGGTQNSTELS